jgi:hypothetical protein
MYARVRELEGRVERLTNLLGSLLEDDERHTRLMALAERTGAALHALESRAAQAGVGAQRFEAALDTVYHARTHGYIACYFVGGRTARMRLLVGTQSPPTQSVGQANSRADLNSYMGAIVRPGEYWMAATHKPGMKAGYECVFTPLF